MSNKDLMSKKYMYDKYSNYDKEYVYANKQNFIKFLNELEEEFYNHNFLRDDRYANIGRHKILIKEMEELYYTKEQCKQNFYNICPTKWCLDSLLEIIFHSNYNNIYEELVNYNKTYYNKTPLECRKIFDEYNNEGIISLNERDYILHGLNMIKDSLDKCDDNLEWNNT